VELEQRDAWLTQIEILQAALAEIKGAILLEFNVPRIGSRLDAVAGKTLVGLNVATRKRDETKPTHAVFKLRSPFVSVPSFRLLFPVNPDLFGCRRLRPHQVTALLPAKGFRFCCRRGIAAVINAIFADGIKQEGALRL
jgi:hypothetical protein